MYVDMRFQKLLAVAETDWDNVEAAAAPLTRRLEDFLEGEADGEEEEEATVTAADDLGGIDELAAEAQLKRQLRPQTTRTQVFNVRVTCWMGDWTS